MSWIANLPTLTPTQGAAIAGMVIGALIEAAVSEWWRQRKQLDDTPIWLLEELHDFIEEMIHQKRDAWHELENPSHYEFTKKVKAEQASEEAA